MLIFQRVCLECSSVQVPERPSAQVPVECPCASSAQVPRVPECLECLEYLKCSSALRVQVSQ